MTPKHRRDVETLFGDRKICRKCGATVETMSNACTADLAALCDGFVAIELALYPDARNLGAAQPEQLKWARDLIGEAVIDNGTEI